MIFKEKKILKKDFGIKKTLYLFVRAFGAFYGRLVWFPCGNYPPGKTPGGFAF